ncbi:DUF3696 domain-containing protein [Priestia megaterium]
MLNNISLENFKAFSKLENIELAPITILCGTNSCGKSSILQSILSFKQSLEGQSREQTFLFNGKYVQLGSFNNVVHNNNVENRMKLSFCFKVKDNLNKSFSMQGPLMKREITSLISKKIFDEVNTEIYLNVELILKYNESNPNKLINSPFIDEFQVNGVLKKEQKQEDIFSLKIKNLEKKKYTIRVKNVKGFRKDEIVNATMESVAMEFANIFPKSFTFEESDVDSEKGIPKSDDVIPGVFYTLQRLEGIVRRLFTSYKYIGPLREEPSRRYIYEDEMLEVGKKGENAAFIYLTQQNMNISKHYFYNMETDKFEIKDRIKLSEALGYWLDLMGIKGFNTEINNDIIQLNLQNENGAKTNIADVGFGVSQLFPIILEGLRMPKGSTLLLEQPEIHLHPKLQMQMADYLLSLAKSQKSMIVETHSEHIINRLVRRIVEDEDNELKKLVRIYFVEPSDDSTGSSVKNVKIDENRGIVNWPRDFFDQAANEQERIMKAGLRKRLGKINFEGEIEW